MLGPIAVNFDTEVLRSLPERDEVVIRDIERELKDGIPEWVGAATFSVDRKLRFLDRGEGYVIFGHAGLGDSVVASRQTGQVYIISAMSVASSRENLVREYVNSSIAKYSRSLIEFAESYPYYRRDDSIEIIQSTVGRIEDRLKLIDPTAIDDQKVNSWSLLLEEFPIGDYSTEFLLEEYDVDCATLV